jgi:DNA end-binding protein Ku
MAARAYWSGRIRLSLVSIPVDVYPATRTASRIAFHQVHQPSGKRIRYEKVVPGQGPIDPEDIVKGYEVEKGKYVLLTDEEIADVRLDAKKSIDLVQFVGQDEIDSIYYDRPYFVLPSEDNEDADEAYLVLREALRRTRKVGIGQIVVRGKSAMVAVRPCGQGLLMESLRYADEVKKCDSAFDGVAEKGVDKELVDLAEELIEKKTAKFQPERIKDAYTVALRELIAAKLEKRPPKEIEETPLVSNVINLMDALKRSVGKGAARDASPSKRRGRAKAATRKRAKPRQRRSGRAKAAA